MTGTHFLKDKYGYFQKGHDRITTDKVLQLLLIFEVCESACSHLIHRLTVATNG